MALLAIRDLEASYGPVRAVRGVSLTVEAGRIVALLGANGAGKTTVLKAISGVVDWRGGDISFEGRSLRGEEPDRIVGRGISHVPEGREIFKERTVFENLLLGAYRRTDRDGVAADIENAFRMFPILRERREQRAGQLSGGQQQMLAISRAMMARPRLILMDEPSLGLSPLLTREIFATIARLREAGATILLVEQNAKMALDIADHAYVMEVGRVRLEGPAARLRDDPLVREYYLGGRPGAEAAPPRPARPRSW